MFRDVLDFLESILLIYTLPLIATFCFASAGLLPSQDRTDGAVDTGYTCTSFGLAVYDRCLRGNGDDCVSMYVGGIADCKDDTSHGRNVCVPNDYDDCDEVVLHENYNRQ